MSEFDIILDSSQQNLKEIPSQVLQMCNLKMLYLQQNFIKDLHKDFFLKLPQLSWLDLRNNHITVIPRSIAHHQNLENLLLSDNKIEVLPNELGLVPKLKVLQLANNPLSYPNSRVVMEGTKAICAYLRHQYEKIARPPSICEVRNNQQPNEEKETPEDEEEIRVMANYCDDLFPMQESLDSSLTVKGLSKTKKEDSVIVHKVTSNPPNKIIIKSYYDDKFVKASTQTSNYNLMQTSLKNNWIDKLKQLLNEQEKVLQQERNLQALSSWRYQRKTEPMRPVLKDKPKAPPYATDPRYDSFLTRTEMENEIDRMIQNNKQPPKKQDLDKLISDLVGQLKEMEASYGDVESPRSEIEAAGSQIMKIMEMHKKLLRLQETNNLTLQ